MTDALTQTTATNVDKAQLSQRIIKNGTQLLEDYVLWHQCGWSDAEFGELLGISAKTVKNRYLADARKQGLIEEHYNSRTEQNSERARNRARPVENSTPIQPTTTTTNDLPHHPASTPQQQCVQADDWGAATVVTAEVVTMPDGEQDYQRAIQLFDEIIALSKRNFANGWTELQWNELGGYCRTFEGCCNARGRRNGSVAKKPVPSAPAFKPCLN